MAHISLTICQRISDKDIFYCQLTFAMVVVTKFRTTMLYETYNFAMQGLKHDKQNQLRPEIQ